MHDIRHVFIAAGLHVYKIGITRSPLHRYANLSYGYILQGFTSMVVLACTTPKWAGGLETALIARFSSSQSEPGCQNEAAGGESVPPAPPVFVYCVFATLEDMIQHRLAVARRESSREC